MLSFSFFQFSNVLCIFQTVHFPFYFAFLYPLTKTFHVFLKIKKVIFLFQPHKSNISILHPELFKYFENYYYINGFHQNLTFTYFLKKLKLFLNQFWFYFYPQNLTADDFKSSKIDSKNKKLHEKLKYPVWFTALSCYFVTKETLLHSH